MNIIAELLKMTSEKYNLMVFDFYIFWCELNSNNSKQLQSMLSNQLLYNWFISQFQMLELEFYDHVSNATNLNLSLKETSKIYQQTTIKIGNYYPPKQLLQKVRKTGLQNAENSIKTNLN